MVWVLFVGYLVWVFGVWVVVLFGVFSWLFCVCLVCCVVGWVLWLVVLLGVITLCFVLFLWCVW